MRAARSAWKSAEASSWSANWRRDSATTVFSTMFGPAMENAEPSIRNSNLLPVKAKGEVRFRSVVSLGKWGSTVTPISMGCLSGP